MRVLHLDAGREMRGGQWQVLRLIQGLADSGVESTLLARAGGRLFAAAQERGLQVEPLTWMRAAQAARRHDLVHAHDARSHTLAAVSGGAPLVVARRVAFPLRSQWKYRRAARIIAVSEYVKKIVIESGVPAGRIVVVPDGVPLLPLAEGSRIFTPDAGGDPLKGASLAVEAGRRAGVDVAVSSDLEADLRGAAILVYLTQIEGLGSGALLAMSSGIAVVASNVGGLREIIRHRENGLLVENEISAIADVIGELARDRELARRLGEAARRTVAERFTIDHMVCGTLAVYKQVLS
jgi:glycosyltransferase involved in cell wall biosynthesis